MARPRVLSGRSPRKNSNSLEYRAEPGFSVSTVALASALSDAEACHDVRSTDVAIIDNPLAMAANVALSKMRDLRPSDILVLK